jgi:hypothetical protein
MSLQQLPWSRICQRARWRVGLDASDYLTSELISMIGTWLGVSQSTALSQAEAGAPASASALMPGATSPAS